MDAPFAGFAVAVLKSSREFCQGIVILALYSCQLDCLKGQTSLARGLCMVQLGPIIMV